MYDPKDPKNFDIIYKVNKFEEDYLMTDTTSPKAWRDAQNKPWIPLKYQLKHYPAANNWMWTYCEFLGSFTHDGKQYDLGLYIGINHHVSYAIVCDNMAGEYLSGQITLTPKDPVLAETVRRGLLMGFIKPI